MELVKNNLMKIFFISIFCLYLIIDLFVFFDNFDFIWIYGNSLKISEGYLPYRDFNLLSTPLFYWIIAFFCKLISYHISVLLIIGALINTLIYYLCYRISFFVIHDKDKALWVTAAIFCFTIINIKCFSYNLLILLFILLIVIIEFKNITHYSVKNHLLIGLLLGAITLTKQSVGLSATVISCTYLLFTFGSIKERILAIFWRCFVLSIVLLTFVIYLIITNSLADFINYAILSLCEFSEKNKVFNFDALIYFIPSVLICFMSLRYVIINRQNLYFKCLLLYSFCAQTICIPIFDGVHAVAANIPFLLLSVFLIPFKKIVINVKTMVTLSFLLGLFISFNEFSRTNWMIYKSSAYYFSGSFIERNKYQHLTKINQYIQEKEKAGFNVIIVDVSGMLYYLAMGKINNQYDYLISGNLGVNGQQRIIDEFNHQPENTLYLVQDIFSNQDIKEIKVMILNNYKQIDRIGSFLVFQQPSLNND